ASSRGARTARWCSSRRACSAPTVWTTSTAPMSSRASSPAAHCSCSSASSFGGGGSGGGGSVLESPYPQLERAFKDVWANNADAISKLYAGTGALKTDFTRYGKRTRRGLIADGVNSVVRFYINNFVDGARQDGVDLLLGCYRPDPSRPSPFVLRPYQVRCVSTPASFLTKLFVLTVAVFTLLILAGPSGNSLQRNLGTAVGTAAALVAVIVWQMVKRGTRMGQNLVALPVLCPEGV
ncbi:unnamed protein product, partial [Phaeothamnion confervicola]